MILPFAESLDGEHGKVVWIFAGYKPDMERLFEHNPGLPSRFPVRLIHYWCWCVDWEQVWWTGDGVPLLASVESMVDAGAAPMLW